MVARKRLVGVIDIQSARDPRVSPITTALCCRLDGGRMGAAKIVNAQL